MSTPQTCISPSPSLDEKQLAADLEAQGHHSPEKKAHKLQVNAARAIEEDVFLAKEGSEAGVGPDFRGVGWKAAFVLLVKT